MKQPDWIVKLHESVRLDIGSATRKVGMSHRSLTGRLTVAQERVEFESARERDFLIMLDLDPTVVNVTAQPCRINYVDPFGKKRFYTPDFLVRYATGRKVIYEVKYRSALKEEWQVLRPKFRAAVGYAREREARFSIMTETEIRNGASLSNLRFLRRYRDAPEDLGIEKTLMSTLAVLGDTPEATPEGLLLAAYCTWENRMLAVRHLWKLIATGELEADIHVPLTMASRIWIASH